MTPILRSTLRQRRRLRILDIPTPHVLIRASGKYISAFTEHKANALTALRFVALVVMSRRLRYEATY